MDGNPYAHRCTRCRCWTVTADKKKLACSNFLCGRVACLECS
jgi:hypothetical protein